MADYRVVYLCADLKRVGPTNQTFNIIVNANEHLDDVLVLTLFDEPADSQKPMFLERGIACKSLSLNRKNPFLGGMKLYSFLKKNKVCLIHSYGVKPDILLFFVSIFTHIPYVLTQRCIPIEDYPTRMPFFVGSFIAMCHTFVLKHSKNVVTCSVYLSSVMKKKYGCDNVTPIQNGVDLLRFAKHDKSEVRKKLGLSECGKIFVSTGLFLTRKHNDELIKAFLSVARESDVLLMLGNGPLFEKCVDQFGSYKKVRFLGLVPNVDEYLASSDIFLSASDSEGLPNAVIEALSCGCPVVLSDIPQHREILDALPSCGELFPLHDVESLAKVIEKCINGNTSYCRDTSMEVEKSPFTMKSVGLSYKKYYASLGNENI